MIEEQFGQPARDIGVPGRQQEKAAQILGRLFEMSRILGTLGCLQEHARMAMHLVRMQSVHESSANRDASQ